MRPERLRAILPRPAEGVPAGRPGRPAVWTDVHTRLGGARPPGPAEGTWSRYPCSARLLNAWSIRGSWTRVSSSLMRSTSDWGTSGGFLIWMSTA
jgi:hypothetical protein